MWIVCLADDSHEMPSLFSQKRLQFEMFFLRIFIQIVSLEKTTIWNDFPRRFIQIVSSLTSENNLPEMSVYFFWEKEQKLHKFAVCWIYQECGKG